MMDKFLLSSFLGRMEAMWWGGWGFFGGFNYDKDGNFKPGGGYNKDPSGKLHHVPGSEGIEGDQGKIEDDHNNVLSVVY